MDVKALVALVVLVVLVVYVVRKMKQPVSTQSGGANNAIAVNAPDNGFTAQVQRQICELADPDNFLRREVVPGNPDVARTVGFKHTAFLPNGDRRDQEELKEGADALGVVPQFTDCSCAPVSSTDKAQVAGNQPFFLDAPYVISYYGKNFYWDMRYPRKPIPLAFLRDEKKFVKQHPQVYPSYVIASRRLKRVQPFESS